MLKVTSDADPIAPLGTPAAVTGLCDENIAAAKAIAEKIRGLEKASDDDLEWKNTFGMFDGMENHLGEAGRVPQLLMVAHPDAAVREAAIACEPKIDAFVSALYVDDAIASVLRRFDARRIETSPVHLRYMEKVLRGYRRNGLSLDAEGRERLRKLNEELTKLGQQFDKNLAEATLSIEIMPAQLDGLPDAYVASHPVMENGHVRVTTDYPDFVPFMKYAKDRNASRKLYALSQNRAKEQNLALLDRLIELRNQKATLLGYASWADYVLEPRMAKNAATVAAFLQDIHVAIKPKREEEFSELKRMAVSLGITLDENVFASDASYLEDHIAKQKFNLDTKALSEYFEVGNVLRGIMEISSTLYGISFHPLETKAWHEDVRVHEVRDADGNVLGRAYFDLYPRENKYKHAAVFPLRGTRRLADGSRELPMAALVCNFPKPGSTPALLSHDDVVTFFHEFGHLLHCLLSQSELASFGGTSVPWDFVEAPSQMFEEWAWDRSVLDLFAKHHATGERLPEDLFDAMTAARSFGEATAVDRQIFLSALDQTYHTREPGFDTSALVEELHPEYSSFTRIPETHFQAAFGHLVGYDAAYYGYQWARSLAFDLFSRFKQEGLLNPKTATEYRKAVLEPGGSEDPNALITRFLGRPPDSRSYKAFLGIGA